MLIFWCILGLFFYHVITKVDTYNPYHSRTRKLPKSTPVKQNEYPFIIGIFYNRVERSYTAAKCLGIILSEYSVLTTATCLEDDWGNEKSFPRSFALRYNIREGCDIHDPFFPRISRHAFYHPLHDDIFRAYDLAYLITYTPIMSKEVDPPTKADLNVESNTTRPADYKKIPEIASIEESLRPGLECMFFGFMNVTMPDGKIVPRLHTSTVQISRREACMKAYAREMVPLTPDKICAGFPDRGVVPTLNDSGGPLLCKSAGEADFKLYGLVSYTSKNGTLPGSFINITMYKDFIDEARKAGENIDAFLKDDNSYGKKFKSQNIYCVIIYIVYCIYNMYIFIPYLNA